MKRSVMVWVGAAIVLLFMCRGARVRADDDSDRRSLISDIDGLLRDAASYLSSASSSTRKDEVERARDYIRKVKDKVSSLDRIKGDDDKARRYADKYPRYADDFDRAAQSLSAMKDDQTKASETPRRCQDLDRQLTEQAERFERDKNGDQIEELRRLALDAGSKAEEWWKAADQLRDQQQRRSDEARRFSVSDDEWSRVTSAQQDVAQRSLDAYMKDFQEVERACRDLRQRDRHPAVERALNSLAGTAKGKDAIYAQLDDKLKRIEGDFRDLFGASSADKVGEARNYMSEIDRLVRDLDQVKGTDKKANQIASTWPDFLRAWPNAANALEGLKNAQKELDDVPGKCATAARDLQDKMDRFRSSNDPDGLHLIPPEAEALGERYTRALSTVDAAKPTREHLVSDVKAFEPRDDRWSPMRSAMRDAAEALNRYWLDHVESAHRACDDLAKGKRNPAVEAFLNALGAKATSDLADFQSRVDAWERDARDIYQLDCKDMQTIWNEWCGIEFEADQELELMGLDQRTQSIIDTEAAKTGGLLARLQPLEVEGQQLVAKPKYKETVEKIQKEVFQKQKSRLQRLGAKNAKWKGTANPATQFVAEYGKQAHDRLASTWKCNVYDKPVPGLGRRRPDCIVVEGQGKCFVYEFKPQNWSGPNPLTAYVNGVTSYYTNNMHRGDAASSELGGAGFQALVESNCRVDTSKKKEDDQLRFDSDFKYYDRCQHQYACESD